MMLEQRYILTADSPVLTSDGRRGRLRQALLSPRHRRLVALVIRYGLLLPRDVVVPAEQIAAFTDAQVRLRLSRAELAHLPAHRPVALAQHVLRGSHHALVAAEYSSGGTSERILEMPRHMAPVLDHRQRDPASELLAVRAGQPVWSQERRVGRIRYLIVDQAHQVRELVVRVGLLPGRDVSVPIAHVDRIDARGVRLALDQGAIEQLPRYQSDRAILAAVERALRADETIRRLDERFIDIAVQGGTVRLSGYVAAAQHVTRAERIARGVAGVRQVVNQLSADSAVTLAVAQALGHHPDTANHRLFVHAARGVAYISGEVPDASTRAAVEFVAASAPGVRGVVNLTRTPNGDAGGEDMRALYPQIGQDVYAVDARLGVVERVIISPRHCRVTAIVTRGWFDSSDGHTRTQIEPAPRRERRLVVPIGAVEHVTPAAVLLHSIAAEAMRFPDLDGDAYAPLTPLEQPPCPYTRAEVLVDRRGGDAARTSQVLQRGEADLSYAGVPVAAQPEILAQ